MAEQISKATTVLLCGVGGQGTILAADLLAHAAMAAGKDVKVSEIHGMSQRGGAVTTVVRFGENVKTMVADLGAVDCVVSFEKMEALRNLAYVADDGYLLVSDEVIKPQSVLTGKTTMPENMDDMLKSSNATIIDAERLALLAGTAKASNVVLLGALSTRLDFPEDAWIETIKTRVPQKTIDMNLKAFQLGRESAC